MARASYAELGDACATAHAMELIGGRWTYPILRELMLGPKRFGALLRSVRGITPAVLTSRLHELSALGLIQPTADRTPESHHGYALTVWALELAPILRDLGRWAQSSPVRTAEGGLTPDAAVQAMMTMSANVTPKMPIRIQLGLTDDQMGGSDEYAYRIEWSDEGFRAERGSLHDPLAAIRCGSNAWTQVLFAGLPLRSSGAMTSGHAETISVLIDTFRGVRETR